MNRVARLRGRKRRLLPRRRRAEVTAEVVDRRGEIRDVVGRVQAVRAVGGRADEELEPRTDSPRHLAVDVDSTSPIPLPFESVTLPVTRSGIGL